MWPKQHVQDIAFLYNVQHDCPLAKCAASGKEPIIQERIKSGLFKTCIEHKPIQRFVINTHAFHNAHHLRAAMERSLVVPLPLYPSEVRKTKHAEFAYSLRATQKAKLQARAAQRKKEAITTVDKAGTAVIPKKRTRLEMEVEDDTPMADSSGVLIL